MVIDLYLNAKKIYRVFIPGLDYLKDSMPVLFLSFPLIPPPSSLSFGQESSLFVLGIVSFGKVCP
jgi:hypothetical protein